ncbi:MAG: 2-oxoglutarate/2-oxoacid ferredoxin oxidoreductase subunit beta [Bacillota bacterium]|nr:2-oxoglutarate oxidoreductase [Bacillota bacterium]MDK2930550.1 2-oxoglutarate/2-oxoacid ferredoxin oxidoreductase subunit beta [Bacillota bacterium]
MQKVFGRPEALADVPTHYCPGCTHGIIHRLIAEVIDELGVRERTVGISPVGCAVLAYDYFNCDFVEASHGRAPAVATGIKRASPNSVVFTYQGDGDLASIGAGEIVHAASRGEKITVIFVNNAIYGMTGGQMAPTTLPGQKTTTSPRGRDPEVAGHPIRICELLSSLSGAAYIARVSVTSPANVAKARRAVKKAFETQLEGRGFSLVEFLSTCPTNWGMTPVEALKWVDDKMAVYYPLGEYTRVPEVG